MNLSIFNFKNNTKELKSVFTLSGLLLFLFAIIYIYLIYYFITSGLQKFILISILGAVLLGLFVFLKKFRSTMFIIILWGILFFCIGEIYYRLYCFNFNGIKRASKYIPASLTNPFSTFPHDDDSYTGLKKSTHGIHKGGSFYINNFGFRDDDWNIKKDDKTIRIAICGMSMSMGVGIDQGKTHPDILENMLNKNDSRYKYDVQNFSIAGYGINNIVDVIETQLPKFNPDIIIFAPEHNDERKEKPIKEFNSSKLTLLKVFLTGPHSLLFFLKAIKQEFIPSVKKQLGLLKEQNNIEDTYFYKNIDEFFQRIKNATRGKKVYVLALRLMTNLDKEINVEQILEERTKKYGFELIDTYHENYGKNVRNMIIYIGDRHPNELAHEIYAKAVYRKLKPYLMKNY